MVLDAGRKEVQKLFHIRLNNQNTQHVLMPTADFEVIIFSTKRYQRYIIYVNKMNPEELSLKGMK